VTSEVVLGVDGGATKTVALVADAAGTILGAGRAGSSDVHAAADPAEPIARIAAAARNALASAGVVAASIAAAAFTVCGADWPEDVELYASRLPAALGLPRRPIVANDAFGALRAGTPDGFGVAVVLGTGIAIGARGPGGSSGTSWHAGYWAEPSGAVELGRRALVALTRGELDAATRPSFEAPALEAFGSASVGELLHTITARHGLGAEGVARLAPILLDAGHLRDPIAAAIVREHAALIAMYAVAAARQVGLDPGRFTLVLSGGVLRHHCSDLFDGIAGDLPGATVVRSTIEPVLGAVLIACDEAGYRPDLDRLRATCPPADFFRTL
jgi:N-acetylglucosamine kinase-like BadF-type ATPase